MARTINSKVPGIGKENKLVEERYFFKTTIDEPFEKAVEKARSALSREGFGVLTEIDVKATIKKKLSADFRPYVILGSCNPELAFRTLQAEEQIGLMLPCNLVVQETAEGQSVVSAINPLVAMESVGNPDLGPVASEVTGKLRRVIESLG